MVKAFKEAKSFYSSELEDETIDQVATNSVGRDRPLAQHPQQSTSAEDLSTAEDLMWEDVEDGERQEFGDIQATEDQENNQTSDHHETFHNNDEDYLTPEIVDSEEIDFNEDERQMDELLRRFENATLRRGSKKKIKRYSCLCHLLQLVMATFDKIQASKQREGSPLPLYSAAIKSARKLVGKFNKSTVATTKLKELCNKKLVADVATRWSSVYLLIRRLLQLREHVKVVCEELGWDCLSNSEWNLLSRIEILLEPFASFTQLVSADRIPTFSSVIPCVEELKMHLIEVRYFLFSHEKLERIFFKLV
jgi:hypothetical protein